MLSFPFKYPLKNYYYPTQGSVFFFYILHFRICKQSRFKIPKTLDIIKHMLNKFQYSVSLSTNGRKVEFSIYNHKKIGILIKQTGTSDLHVCLSPRGEKIRVINKRLFTQLIICRKRQQKSEKEKKK